MTAAVSVVVVSWNTREALARCLSSVAADPVGAAAELWVVDNASADRSAEMVVRRFPGAHLIVNDANLGFAAACNQALTRATGRVVVLLNSDATLEAGALERLCQVLYDRPSIGVVGALLVGPDGRAQRCYGQIPGVGAFVSEMLGATRVPGLRRLLPAVATAPRRQERGRDVGYVSGACLAFRRELLDVVGLLDERYFLYFEETDLCLRAHRAGLEVWFDPAARAYHQGQASAVQLGPEAELHYARSAYAFVRKHHGPAAARRLSIAFRLWLAGHLAVHRLQALARRPGADATLARKRQLRGLHRALGLPRGDRRCAA